MNLEEYQCYFLDKFREYKDRFNEWPEVCYCTIEIYDGLMEAIRDRAANLSDPLNFHYLEIYLHMKSQYHYSTFLGVRLYRCNIEKVDFNVPRRLNSEYF